MSPHPPFAALDPVDEMFAKEEAADHAKAVQRGVRVLRLTNDLISRLQARGYPVPAEDLRVELFHTIATELYGNAAIDIPTLRTT